MTQAQIIDATHLIEAGKYAQLGWFVFPVHSVDKDGRCSCGSECGNPGKHPRTPRGFKDASLDAVDIQDWWTKWPDANIGIDLGRSKLVALDIDPRNGGDESFVELERRHGAVPPTRTNLTGGGGQHYLFRLPDGVEKVSSCVPAQGVEIKSSGSYIVLPPSSHWSGRRYVWDSGQPDELAPAPFWICSKVPRKDQFATRSPADGALGIAFIAAGMAGRRLGPDRMAVQCPWADGHSTGEDYDTSTVVFGPSGRDGIGWFHCSHATCKARFEGRSLTDRWKLICDALPAEAVKEARTHMPKLAERQERVAIIEPWENSLRWNAAGTALTKEPGNLALLFANMIEWKDVFRYDESRDRVYWAKNPPELDGMRAPERGAIGDFDYIYITQWFTLNKRFRVAFPKDVVRDCVLASASANRHNSLTDHLDSLVWDGTSRLDRWLHLYLGAVDNPYTRFVGAAWLVSAMARAYSPGCQADHVLTLEGKQGVGKTTAFRILGGEWYTGHVPRLDDKDARLQLVTSWICEFQELAAFRGIEQQKIKAFISDCYDQYRPPYGANVVRKARRCVFAASTNEGDYIADSTGARRFWPVLCQRVRIGALREDRDVLLAEAREAYRRGMLWYPTTDAIYSEQLAEEQETRMTAHPWETPLRVYLQRRNDHATEEFTAEELLACCGVEIGRATQNDANTIARLMRRIGYDKARRRIDGVLKYIWWRPDTPR